MTTDRSNTTICHKTDSGNIITAKGVIMSDKFLLEPGLNKAGKQNKHQLEIVFAPGTNLTLLKNEMGKVALEGLKGDADAAKKMVEKRFLDPNDKPSGGKPLGPEFEGWTLVRAATDHLPDFVFPNGKRCPAESVRNELYRGRWGRATINPYWLDTTTTDGTKIKGVFLGLVNIQLLEHGKAIGFVKPDGEAEFGAVEVADTAASPVSETTENKDGNVDALFG